MTLYQCNLCPDMHDSAGPTCQPTVEVIDVNDIIKERDKLLERVRELDGTYDIHCDCCGNLAATGLCKDGQALECGCAGHITVDGENDVYANTGEEECPPEALCQPGNDPFSQAVQSLETERDQLKARVAELEKQVANWVQHEANKDFPGV